MKKLLMLLLLLPLSVAAYADEPFRYEMRFGVAGAPLVEMTLLTQDYTKGYNYHNSITLEDIYGDYCRRSYVTGQLSAEFNFIFRKWFTLSLGANACVLTSRMHDGYTGNYEYSSNGFSLTFLPQARFTYLSKKYVKMYSAAGLGLAYYSSPSSASILPVIQVAPVGIMVGNKVFGFAELGLGTMFTGGMVGVGFRF